MQELQVSQDSFSRWLESDITKLFFLELSERYLSNAIDEPVVMASLEKISMVSNLAHTNPVSETAIKAAVKSGRNAELVELMEWEPGNLEREEDDENE